MLVYKIINNLAMVPHSCLEKADGRTRKKHKVTTWILMDNRSFLNVLVRGMALLKKLQRPTLWIYLSLNRHIRPHADLSAITFVKESCWLQNQNQNPEWLLNQTWRADPIGQWLQAVLYLGEDHYPPIGQLPIIFKDFKGVQKSIKKMEKN